MKIGIEHCACPVERETVSSKTRTRGAGFKVELVGGVDKEEILRNGSPIGQHFILKKGRTDWDR